jgi:hypothetical protein
VIRNPLAQANEGMLPQRSFHPVDVLVDPLDVAFDVTFVTVNAIYRSGGVASDGQSDGKPRQGTTLFLGQEQAPEVVFGDLDANSPSLGVAAEAVVERPGEASRACERGEGRASTIRGLHTFQEAHEYRSFPATIAPAQGHSSASGVMGEPLDGQFPVPGSRSVLDLPRMGARMTADGFAEPDSVRHHINGVSTNTAGTDPLVSAARRVVVVGKKLDYDKVARGCSYFNVWNPGRHLSPPLGKVSVA